MQFEAARAGLVNTADISELPKPCHQPVDPFVCVGEFKACPDAFGIVPDGSSNDAFLREGEKTGEKNPIMENRGMM